MKPCKFTSRYVTPTTEYIAARLRQSTTDRLTIGNTPLHNLHLSDARHLEPSFRHCTSLTSITVHLQYVASSVALEVLLQGAATCRSLQRLHIVGGVSQMEGRAIGVGLAAFTAMEWLAPHSSPPSSPGTAMRHHRCHRPLHPLLPSQQPSRPLPASARYLQTEQQAPLTVSSPLARGGGVMWRYSPITQTKPSTPPLPRPHAQSKPPRPWLEALQRGGVRLVLELNQMDEQSAESILAGLRASQRFTRVELRLRNGTAAALAQQHHFMAKVKPLIARQRRCLTSREEAAVVPSRVVSPSLFSAAPLRRDDKGVGLPPSDRLRRWQPTVKSRAVQRRSPLEPCVASTSSRSPDEGTPFAPVVSPRRVDRFRCCSHRGSTERRDSGSQTPRRVYSPAQWFLQHSASEDGRHISTAALRTSGAGSPVAPSLLSPMSTSHRSASPLPRPPTEEAYRSLMQHRPQQPPCERATPPQHGSQRYEDHRSTRHDRPHTPPLQQHHQQQHRPFLSPRRFEAAAQRHTALLSPHCGSHRVVDRQLHHCSDDVAPPVSPEPSCTCFVCHPHQDNRVGWARPVEVAGLQPSSPAASRAAFLAAAVTPPSPSSPHAMTPPRTSETTTDEEAVVNRRPEHRAPTVTRGVPAAQPISRFSRRPNGGAVAAVARDGTPPSPAAATTCRMASLLAGPSLLSRRSYSAPRNGDAKSPSAAAAGESDGGYLVYPSSINFIEQRVADINRHVVWQQVHSASEVERCTKRLDELQTNFASCVTEQLTDIVMALVDMRHSHWIAEPL